MLIWELWNQGTPLAMALAEQANSKRRPPTSLNDLPESLLIHILTFLPILFAIRTTVLSRQWRNLWQLLPILKFNPDDESLFSHEAEYDLRLAHTITQVIFNRPKSNPLRKFVLDFFYGGTHRHRSFVTSWIRYALDCNAEEMTLVFYYEDDEVMYQFHFLDIKNRHVRCLRLCHCEIVMPTVDCIRFDSLQDLKLTQVVVNDGSLADLISRCRNLERLSLHHLHGLDKFKIRSKSLKFLSMRFYLSGNDESLIEIHAPNLSEIQVDRFYVENYAGDLSSVKQVLLCFYNFHQNLQKCLHFFLLHGVESLKIKAILPRYILSRFESNGFKLEKLKHLEIQTGNSFRDMLGVCLLLERAPALQTLVFDDILRNNEEASLDKFNNNMSCKLHIPSLLEVKMKQFRNTTFEYWMLLLLWKHGVILNKVFLVPATLGQPTTVLDPTSNDFMKFLVQRRTG